MDNALSARQHYQYQEIKRQEQYEAAKSTERLMPATIEMYLKLARCEKYASYHGAIYIRNCYDQFNIQAALFEAMGGNDIAPPVIEYKK